MKPVELEVFFHTDSTKIEMDLGTDPQFSDCEKRKVTFYNINAVTKYLDEMDNNREYSKVISNGDYFICNYSYNELIEKIRIAQLKRE